MSAPQTGAGKTVGGEIASAFGGPVKPQPAAPLTDEQLRLECVKQAIAANVDSRFVTESADRFVQYVKTGTANSGGSLKKGEGA